jgi:hypothetical protein
MAQSVAVRQFGFMAPAEAWVTFLLGGISLVIGVLALRNPISAVRKRVIIGLAAAGVVIAALPIFKIGNDESKADAGAAPPSTLAEVRKGVSITKPDDGTIPLCAVLEGRAPVVAGKILWLAYRKEENSNYIYILPTRQSGDPEAWSTPRSVIGDSKSADDSYRFYAFYATNDLSQFIANTRAGIRASEAKVRPYVYTVSLPFAVQDNAPLKIMKRSDDNTPCS